MLLKIYANANCRIPAKTAHKCTVKAKVTGYQCVIDNTSAEWGPQTLRQVCSREDPESAMCVQNFDDSRGLAIRITYRISLRSSSLWDPRHPLLKVVIIGLPEEPEGSRGSFRSVYIVFSNGRHHSESTDRGRVRLQHLVLFDLC